MKNTSYIRIGLMGSSCSGKTTTARIMAKKLNLELQEEIESMLLAEWISFGKIANKTDLYPELLKELQEQALNTREQNSILIRRGISDRTTAELLVYNRLRVQRYFSADYAEDFTQRCEIVMRTYTHLFLFPRGVLLLEDNGVRTMDLDYQKKVHNSLLDVLNEFDLSYIPLSYERLTRDQRVQEVTEWLKI